MTKKGLITRISKEADISMETAEKAYNALLSGIADALVAGERVMLPDFGVFKPKDSPEREAWNPQKGEKCICPARRKAAFTPAKTLKEAVNAKYA